MDCSEEGMAEVMWQSLTPPLFLPSFLPSFLLPSCLPACQFAYLPLCRPACLPTCPHSGESTQHQLFVVLVRDQVLGDVL